MKCKIKAFIDDNQLLNHGDKIILGVSGGADSVAMLDILIRLGYKIVVAHCNFHLRSLESLRDEEFVRKLSERYGLEYVKQDFDTLKYAASNSVSIEMAARDLRYTWFEELRVQYHAQAIVVAHHKDDSIETVLMNLVRGTGIKGLVGIEPKVGKIIRPFLCVFREEVEQYAEKENLEYITDSSNRESVYTRNMIRLDIMPLLERINPSLREAMNRTMRNLQQVKSIYNHYIEQQKALVFNEDRIDIQLLKSCIEPQAVLYEILSVFGFTPSTVEDIYMSLDKESGRLFYSNDYELLKDREYILIQLKEELRNVEYVLSEEADLVNQPLPLKIETFDYHNNISLKADKNVLFADYDKLKFPLKIRKWQQGDKFYPFGMKGTQKLSDYFSNNKFSLFDKNNSWILCSEDDIIWLMNHRSDDRFKVDDKTKKVVKIEILETV